MVRLVVVAALAMIVAACGGPAQPTRDSTRAWLAAPSYGAQYGLLWWLRSAAGASDVAEAWGARAQHIFVVRPMKLVVVVTARDERTDSGRQILDEILASVTTGR